MNNEDLRNSIVQKWQPIVKEICKEFSPEDINRVCEFAHYFILDEASQQENYENLNNIIRQHDEKFNLFVYNTVRKSLIEINLKTISMIKDMSQVVFMPLPVFEYAELIKGTDEDGIMILRKKPKFIQVGEAMHKIKVDKDLLIEQYSKDKIHEEIESCIAETVANKINEHISLGNKVYLYHPIQRIIRKSGPIVNSLKNSEPEYDIFEIYSRCAYVES